MNTENQTPGQRLKKALVTENPLAVVGAINAYCALLAEKAGFNAIYLSGAGVANASFGKPDLGLTTLDDVLTDVSRITAITQIPLVVDADTGFGDSAMTTRKLIHAGAAAMQIEDQIDDKRCGHRSGKRLVSIQKMRDRVKASLDARTDKDFVLIARTDAHEVEGLKAAIDRAGNYVDAGADIIFAEALTDIKEYETFCSSISVPVLANITEFGKTPLYTQVELANAGVRLVLYPLTAFRAMSAAALKTYQTVREEGTQISVLDNLQNRNELYDILDYYRYEKELDIKLSTNKD